VGDNDRVTPDPQRVASGEDAAAEEILALARDGVTADLLGCLVSRDAIALARYGSRQVTRALRTRSVALLHDALLASAIAATVRLSDERDVMVSMARHYYVAQQLGHDPAEVFDAAVSGLPDGPVRDLFRAFGTRKDVTLEAFGWQLVQTDDGPGFKPKDDSPPERPLSLVQEQEAAQRRRNYLEATFGTRGADQIQRSNRKLFGNEHQASGGTD
jgi:hypothetical protein